jgi:tryptophanyl-tRNA synthetase
MGKRLFSGIQPSGNLHLGNYLGAIKQWVELQEDNEAIFCIVDLHAITVPQDPVELRKKTLEIAKIYLASGIDPKKSTLFIQSHIAAHTELAWILNTIAHMGDLDKMTQFKEKSRKNILKKKIGEEVIERSAMTADDYVKYVLNRVSVGLFDYPVLMAADILLYDTNVVPVGKDQMQHIELARDLAERFNKRFGETFVIPEGKLSKEGQLIMGLDDPSKKMSKSATSEYNYIALTDNADTVRRKIKKAVTDSGSEIVYSDDPSSAEAGKPALRNLINIYSLLSGKTPKEIEAMYVGKGYGDFKTDLAEVVVNFLTPFQERLAAISDDEVLEILKTGAEKVKPMAREKMRQVFDKVGLISY